MYSKLHSKLCDYLYKLINTNKIAFLNKNSAEGQILMAHTSFSQYSVDIWNTIMHFI